jgi:hypothetical protein
MDRKEDVITAIDIDPPTALLNSSTRKATTAENDAKGLHSSAGQVKVERHCQGNWGWSLP